VIQEQYSKALQDEDKLKKQINEFEKEIRPISEELESLIVGICDKEGSTYEEAEKFLSDPQSGLIIRRLNECNNNKKQVIELDDITDLSVKVQSIITNMEKIQKSNAEILSDIESVNLINLYKAINNVAEKDKCPACQTPLGCAVVNPFENAKTELKKFNKIEETKASVKQNASSVAQMYERILNIISSIDKTGLFPSIDFNILVNKHLQKTEVEIMDSNVMVIYGELKKVESLLRDPEEIKSDIIAYNVAAQSCNKVFDDKLLEAQDLQAKLVQRHSDFVAKAEVIRELKNQLHEIEISSKELKRKAEQEEQDIEFNKKMITAYNSLVGRLRAYVLELPVQMAGNLSEKIRDYYNQINEDDADFELIEELRIPVAPSEKIIIKMHDGAEQDALQILSEGHVKILGLAILLAKAVYEKSKFLIFDDIVNSIDDDHRDGVARLLITNRDFTDMQMILTCHGELFVSKLEDYVTDKRDMARYMFLPADSLEERGVFIKYQDSSIPLKTAREKYEEGNLKDSAAKCRQAVECITGKLWKKLSGYVNGGISVCIRSLNSGPDLYSITTSLYGATKKGFEGMEDIHSDLGTLKDNSMWSVLNKGTHIDDKIPEFTRPEIKKLLELLEKLGREVDELKIKPCAHSE